MSRSRIGMACAALALVCAGTAYGLDPNYKLTQYFHRIWQAQQGLPQTSIYAVRQMNDGYLWVGTQSGIVRFDGSDFTPLPQLQNAGLGDVWARVIIEDKRGQTWINANDFGLIRMNAESVTVLSEKDGLPTKNFSCLVAAPNGDVWTCTASGLVRFRGDSAKIDVYQNPSLFPTRPIAACIANDGKVWLGGGSTLAVWDGSTFKRADIRKVAGGLAIRALRCSEQGVWVGTAKGLLQIHDGKETLYTVKDGLADNLILSLAQGDSGDLWIGTKNGFNRLTKGASGTFDSYGYRDGLSHNTVTAIHEDREGTLWVATGHGLNQFLNGAFTRFAKSEGLPSDNMGPLLQDRAGTLWAGSLEGGLARFDGHRFQSLPGLAPWRIATLAEGPNGGLWAGTDRGLLHVVNGQVQQTYGRAEGLPSERVRSIFRDHSGSMWVGTEAGLAVYRDGRFTQDQTLAVELPLPIVAIGEDAAHTMLFSVEHGNVYGYAEGKLHKLESPNAGLPLQEVTSIFKDKDGYVWMASSGFGAALLDRGKLTRFFVRDGLFDTDNYGLIVDAHDRLWFSCSKGFYWVNRADFLAFAAGKRKNIVSSPYSPLDGLRTIQGTPGAQPPGVLAQDGRLWFSASRGLLAFESDLGSQDVPPPPVVIGKVTANGAVVTPAQIRQLGPGRHNLTIEYGALSYLAPARMNYRYKLEGFDADWTEAGNRRTAFYTNLPPGPYRFRATACGEPVPCNTQGAGIDFEIAPALYQRSWFIPLCVGVLALLAFAIYRLRVRQLRAQFVLVLGERSRIARELHDTLIQGFSGITMQMQAFASRVRSPQDKQVLQDIIEDAGTCLVETRRSVAGLRGGAGATRGLADAIAEAARHLTEEREVRLRLNLDDGHVELPAEIKYNLVRIVQEAVSNAVKHGEARNVEINLHPAGHALRIEIRDDGRGFSSARPAEDAGGEAGEREPGHYGIIGMKERAHHIGAEFALVSAPGSGTHISLTLPVTKDAALASVQRNSDRSVESVS